MRQYVVYYHRDKGYNPAMNWSWTMVDASSLEEAWELARQEFGDRAYNVLLWPKRRAR